MEYIINHVGEDAVGIGTDFTQGYVQRFFEWISRDKGVRDVSAKTPFPTTPSGWCRWIRGCPYARPPRSGFSRQISRSGRWSAIFWHGFAGRDERLDFYRIYDTG
ncbi:hypothetical protein [Paracoccus aminovorans]|nr:hypothetical protein [Paracoccus aminovorans]